MPSKHVTSSNAQQIDIKTDHKSNRLEISSGSIIGGRYRLLHMPAASASSTSSVLMLRRVPPTLSDSCTDLGDTFRRDRPRRWVVAVQSWKILVVVLLVYKPARHRTRLPAMREKRQKRLCGIGAVEGDFFFSKSMFWQHIDLKTSLSYFEYILTSIY